MAAMAAFQLQRGSTLDRALVVEFMERTYREMDPEQPLGHLAATVEAHLSAETPLWWAVADGKKVGGLWLGNAIDQHSGCRHAYVLLLYVLPGYRRQGIATALLQAAQLWAAQRGDAQISLQVFHQNQGALSLYRQLGYAPYAVTLVKPLPPPSDRS